ncbi:MAG: hypothetical protein ACREMA_08405, partial [Longimicrobiales bacterium]
MVNPDPVYAIELRPDVASMTAGGRLAIEAIVLDFDRTRLENRAVLFASSSPSVARVSTDGVVEG